MADRTQSAMGGAKKKSKTSKGKKSKKSSSFKSMHIRKMSGKDNPGYLITHEQHPDAASGTIPEPDEHSAGDEQELAAHVQQHAPNMGPAPEPEPMQPGQMQGQM